MKTGLLFGPHGKSGMTNGWSNKMLIPGISMISYVSRGIIGSNEICPLPKANSCSMQMIEITAVSSDRNP